MALNIAGIAVPGPSQVLGTVNALAGWGARTVTLVAELPERASSLLDATEGLIRRINEVADRADDLVTRVDAVTGAAERTVRYARSVADSTAEVLAQAGGLSRDASELLTSYQPLATQAAPLAKRFVEELSEREIIAAVRLVDQLPQLAEHMETDVMPLLATLDRVGPDMHELLDVVKDLRQAVNGIPALGYLRRRGMRPEEVPEA